VIPTFPVQYRPRRTSVARPTHPSDAEGCGVVYRFGGFTVNADTRQLLTDGADVHVSPKAFDLLALLLANRERAVPKAELQERLWPSTFVEETNLAGLIVEIRRALHDSASNPAFVRTVYGFGYRFIGNVVEEAGQRWSGLSPVAPRLVIDGRDVILMEGANVIGRAPDATIALDARGLSRYHARVLLSRGEATLEDLGSKNGTHVNGRRITSPVRLSDGDEIRLGELSLRFTTARTANPTETVG
jgi:DNA-binding winged helix-turn-helix (wHTH) protein